MKKLLVLALTLFTSLASAQDITNHALPVGGGPGVVGWRVIGPCLSTQVLVWPSGVSADPACGAIPIGSIALTNGQIFVGNASNIATSVALSGDCTIINTGVVTCNNFTHSLVPLTSDGGALGSTTRMWSDLFLASGGVINWNNGTAALFQGDKTATVTFTLASPMVVTWASHGLVAGSRVYFTTTNSLPNVSAPAGSGILPGRTYYVIAAGLGASTFQISSTPAGAAINCATCTQAGTHTGRQPTLMADGQFLIDPGTATPNETTSLVIMKSNPVSTNLDLIDDDASSGFNRYFLRMYQTSLTKDALVYFNAGGHFYSRLSMTVSGFVTGAGGPSYVISNVSADPYMIGARSDIDGPAIQSRGTFVAGVSGLSSRVFDGLDISGQHNISIRDDGRITWGDPAGAGTYVAQDTGLSRIGAATLAIGNTTAGDFSGTVKLTGIVQLGYTEMTEIVAPAAGAVNTARIYAKDNGAGKTQVCALFNTGAEQCFATQP